MSTVTTPVKYTPEDLLVLPNEDRYELVNGNLVERPMGSESNWIAGVLVHLLSNFSQPKRLGWVWGDNAYQCFPDDPSKVRKPDVSFIRWGRLPGNRPALGYERIAPDLAVEVLSPNDLAYEIDLKVEDYLRAGVSLVWVINPETRTVRVHRPDGSDTRLHEDDELTGEGVLPGFVCRVGDLFPPVASPDSVP